MVQKPPCGREPPTREEIRGSRGGGVGGHLRYSSRAVRSLVPRPGAHRKSGAVPLECSPLRSCSPAAAHVSAAVRRSRDRSRANAPTVALVRPPGGTTASPPFWAPGRSQPSTDVQCRRGVGTGTSARADGFLVRSHGRVDARGRASWTGELRPRRGSTGSVFDASDRTCQAVGAPRAGRLDSEVRAVVTLHLGALSADFVVSGTGSSVFRAKPGLHGQLQLARHVRADVRQFQPANLRQRLLQQRTALIDVHATAFAPGIPEPGRASMMLAGLALTASLGLRRRPRPLRSD